MRVHLVNPSDDSFGIGVIPPRWLYVLAGSTPRSYGDPVICDETLEKLDLNTVEKGDVVGIGIHTGNACRGLAVGQEVRKRGAWVVYGGIHATLYPDEAFNLGAAHVVVQGDGDVVWQQVLADCAAGNPDRIYNGGQVPATQMRAARWDLAPESSYMWASVQTVRGCPKHCSFCSVWRTDGQEPRQRGPEVVVEEIVQLRRLGYRFIALADDNFYPVTLTDIELARKQNNMQRLEQLQTLRAERFELMGLLAQLPKDMVFFTQITMECAEDPEFLEAMRKANIKGALVGVESVTEAGLKSVFKDFNLSGEGLVTRLKAFREHGVHVLGSFIFGLPTDVPSSFDATAELALRADLTFAQFVTMTPYPGTVDFLRWEKMLGDNPPMVDGVPITRYWRIPAHRRPKKYGDHPSMQHEEIRQRTQKVWDDFYSSSAVWARAKCVKSLKARLAFFFISKLYRQMYANTGITTDSARRKSANRWARYFAMLSLRLFRTTPMPELQMPSAVNVQREPLGSLAQQ